jgi:predicted nucleotidyltransferase
MSAEAILKERQGALAELCRLHRVQRLEVFGSGTDESFDPASSDFDMLVTFEPCSPSQHYERYFGLLEALEALFERPVDLVEPSAMRNPFFIRQVNESRRLLYAA